MYVTLIAKVFVMSLLFRKVLTFSNHLDVNSNYVLLDREQWGAKLPVEVTPLTQPLPYVVIHHSYSPGACYSQQECSQAMRDMQKFHMVDRKWWDIGYNFGVGADGVVYEGRGWKSLGAHSLHFNRVSIGICLIGDWSSCLPPQIQMNAAMALIQDGVERGHLIKDYKIVGHRQVRANTTCPGDVLYENLKTWNHYSAFPACADDLQFVEELKAINT